MVFFAVYAVFVWYLALRWRRRVAGVVCVVIGTLLVYWVGRYVPGWFADHVGQVGVRWLLYAEAAIVGGIGAFIVVMPRAPEYPHCAYCRYDLRGLADEATECPECGQPLKGFERLTPIPSVLRAAMKAGERGSTPSEPPQRAEQQDPQR